LRGITAEFGELHGVVVTTSQAVTPRVTGNAVAAGAGGNRGPTVGQPSPVGTLFAGLAKCLTCVAKLGALKLPPKTNSMADLMLGDIHSRDLWVR